MAKTRFAASWMQFDIALMVANWPNLYLWLPAGPIWAMGLRPTQMELRVVIDSCI